MCARNDAHWIGSWRVYIIAVVVVVAVVNIIIIMSFPRPPTANLHNLQRQTRPRNQSRADVHHTRNDGIEMRELGGATYYETANSMNEIPVYWTDAKICAVIIGITLALFASIIIIFMLAGGLNWAYSEGTLVKTEFDDAIALGINLMQQAALAARYEQACMFAMLCEQLRTDLPGVSCDFTRTTLDATCPHITAFDGPVTSGDVESALRGSSGTSSPNSFNDQLSALDKTTPSSPSDSPSSSSSW